MISFLESIQWDNTKRVCKTIKICYKLVNLHFKKKTVQVSLSCAEYFLNVKVSLADLFQATHFLFYLITCFIGRVSVAAKKQHD